jgi:Nuclease A inhibitor-like protein
MADDAATAIQKAAAGLLYPSESDAAFDLVRWDATKGDPSPATVGALARKGKKGRPVEEVPVAEFFAALAQTDDAAKFKALEQTLKKTLTDLRVYRVGRARWTSTSWGRPPPASGRVCTPPRSRPELVGLPGPIPEPTTGIPIRLMM